MTVTCAVQLPLAGMVPPEKVSVVAAADGLNVAPAQVVLAAGVPATCTPEGNVSEKAAAVRATALVFVNVKVRTDVLPAAMVDRLKFLLMVGLTAVPQPVKKISS